jgi:uncharacterized membrane protein YccC
MLSSIAILRSISGPWQFSVAAGVRTTTATLVPLVLGQVLGQPAAGLMVSMGGLNVSLSDIGDLYRTKAVTMGVATLSLAAAAFLSTVVSGILWVAVPLMFVLACAAGLVGVFGNAAAKVSFLSLVVVVIMAGLPAGATEGAERSMAIVGGGLWAMVLSLGLWPLRPYQPVRDAVAACYRAISRFIGVACRVDRQRHDPGSGWEAAVIQERAAVVEAIAQARSITMAVRASRAGMSPTGQRLLVLLRSAHAIFDAAIALAETLATAADQARGAQVRAAVEDAVPRLTVAVAALGTAIGQGHDHVELNTLHQALAAVDDTLAALQRTASPPAADETDSIDPRTTAWSLETVAGHIRAAADILAAPADRGVAPPHPVAERQAWRARLGGIVTMLKDNLTFRSLAFRHALRLGVTATAALAFYRFLDLPHGAWLTLTAIVILKPNFGGTYQQAVQRVGGTVAGSIMGAILAGAITDLYVLDAFLVPFGILAYSLMAHNYGLGVLFLTPFIVLLLNTVQMGDWQVAAVRSLDTVLGGVLALLAGYLLWPSWERQRLPEQLARTIAANRDYFRTVASGYVGQQSSLAVIESTRAQAQLENANAAAAFQRLLSEPQTQHLPIEPIYALVSYNQRFYDAVTTLAVNQPAIDHPQALPGLEAFIKQVDAALQDLQEAVRNRPPPTGLSIYEKSLGEARAYIHTLTSRRGAQPAAAGTDPPQRDAVRDVAPLRTELERLADEVVEMAKIVESRYRPETKPSGWSRTSQFRRNTS